MSHTLGAPEPQTDIVVCPCDAQCGVVSLKGLSRKTGHAPNCGLERYGATARCRPCEGRRSQKKGQRGQAKTHRNLGGFGRTPSNEETARPYEVTVTVLPEVKAGEQIPKAFDTFIGTDWFRRALSQSARAVPVGSGALPCVVLRGDWAIIDIRSSAKREPDVRP